MTKQEQILEREKKFLDLLSDGKEVDKDYLKDTLHVQIRTLEKIREKVNKEGYCVVRSGKGRWRRLLENEAEECKADEKQEQSNPYDAQAAIYMSMLLVEDFGQTENELYRTVWESQRYEKTNEMRRASQSKAFMDRLRILEETGFITVDEYKEIHRGENAPVFIPVMTNDYEDDSCGDAWELEEVLGRYDSNDNEVLKRLRDKISYILSREMVGENSGYKKIKRWSDSSKILDLINGKFGAADYREMTCEITFVSGKGKSHTEAVDVGCLLYSREQNELYVLGKNVETGEIKQIRAGRITGVRELERENNEYCSKEFIDIYNKMFGTGYAAPEEVEVHFDIYGNVEDKIIQLAESREDTAELTRIVVEGREKLVYTDTIIGLPDFAAYLRQFGYSCEVIKPAKLRNMMKKSADRLLERYRMEGMCE